MTHAVTWAVVPVKEFAQAKQRLAGLLSPEQRHRLAECMVADVLEALAEAPELAGLLVVTCDPLAAAMAGRAGARVVTDHAREGQTAAVAAAARLLAREGVQAMLALPGDIPLITSAEISALLCAHPPPPAFSIVPAHDRRGSNAVLCSPPDAVPLQFGDDSFLPHLAASHRAGIEPTIVELPGIALDIDRPEDLVTLARARPSERTRTLHWISECGVLSGSGGHRAAAEPDF